jgi:hypothetical protein
METAQWQHPVTQAQVIAAVQRYLSRPLTEAYFEAPKKEATPG